MIAAYTDADRQRLLVNPGIVRNRRKIDAFVTNTQCFLVVQKEFGTFDAYIWGFTGHRTLRRPGVLSWGEHAGSLPRIRRDGEGPEEAGVQVCGDGDLLRLHAGRGNGQ